MTPLPHHPGNKSRQPGRAPPSVRAHATHERTTQIRPRTAPTPAVRTPAPQSHRTPRTAHIPFSHPPTRKASNAADLAPPASRFRRERRRPHTTKPPRERIAQIPSPATHARPTRRTAPVLQPRLLRPPMLRPRGDRAPHRQAPPRIPRRTRLAVSQLRSRVRAQRASRSV